MCNGIAVIVRKKEPNDAYWNVAGNSHSNLFKNMGVTAEKEAEWWSLEYSALLDELAVDDFQTEKSLPPNTVLDNALLRIREEITSFYRKAEIENFIGETTRDITNISYLPFMYRKGNEPEKQGKRIETAKNVLESVVNFIKSESKKASPLFDHSSVHWVAFRNSLFSCGVDSVENRVRLMAMTAIWYAVSAIHESCEPPTLPRDLEFQWGDEDEDTDDYEDEEDDDEDWDEDEDDIDEE